MLLKTKPRLRRDGSLRASPTRSKDVRVDRDAGAAGVIRGVNVIQLGKTRSKPFLIDEITLDQVVEGGNRRELGVKSRLGHPGMCTEPTGTELGRVRNFRLSDDESTVIADLHVLECAHETPHGDLAEWLLGMAEEDPGQIALSIVPRAFSPEPVLDEDGEPVIDHETGEPLERYRMGGLGMVDVVDEGAATRGLFGDELGVQMFAHLNRSITNLAAPEPDDESMHAWLTNVLGSMASQGGAMQLIRQAKSRLANDELSLDRAASFINDLFARRGGRTHRPLTALDIERILKPARRSAMYFDSQGNPIAPEALRAGMVVFDSSGNRVVFNPPDPLSTDPPPAPAPAPAPAPPAPAPADPAPTLSPEALAEAERRGAAAELARVREIRALGQAHSSYDLDEVIESCINDRVDLGESRRRVLESIGSQATPTGGSGTITAGLDVRDKFMREAEAMLCHRSSMLAEHPRDDEETRSEKTELRGLVRSGSLSSVRVNDIGRVFARDVLGVAGADRFDDRKLFDCLFNLNAFSHFSSSFPLLFANVGNKAVINGFNAAVTTWDRWTMIGSLNDFKAADRIRLSESPLLLKNLEGEPAAEATFNEQKESIQAARYSRGFSWTYEMQRNDDLGAFTNIASMMGSGANRTVEKAIWDLMFLNSGLGPTLNADSKAVFHADHNNTGSAGNVSQTTIEEGLTKMAEQKGIGDDGSDTALGIMPRYLLHGVSQKFNASAVIRAATIEAAGTGQRAPQIEDIASIIPIEVPTLSINATYKNSWYLVADQNQAPSMEVAFLDGIRLPQTRLADGVTIDGTRVVTRLYFDAAVTGGHQGMFRNAGA